MIKADIDDFKSYIASEKGLSNNTIEAYLRDLTRFALFLEKEQIIAFNEVKEEHIMKFLKELQESNFASATLSRIMISVKVLFRFLKRERLVDTNITLYLESPKLWQLIPEVLNLDEIEAILSQINPQTQLGCRDKAIIELLYSSGLRVSEACSLSIYDIDDKFVRVFGKGGKERLVPIGKEALLAIDHYLLHFRDVQKNKELTNLFLSKKGKPLDRITVWKIVKHWAKKAGIKRKISPHTFRHSFATHLLDNGADLRVIQEFLGHSNIKTTDRYTHISQKKVKEAFYNFHPRN